MKCALWSVHGRFSNLTLSPGLEVPVPRAWDDELKYRSTKVPKMIPPYKKSTSAVIL